MSDSVWSQDNARILRVLADGTRWNLMEIFTETRAPESLKSLRNKLEFKGVKITKENLSKHLKLMAAVGLIQQRKYESYIPISPERYREIFKLVQEISRICDIGKRIGETNALYPHIELQRKGPTRDKMVLSFEDSLSILMKPENFIWPTADEKRELFLKAVKIGVDFTKIL